MRRVAAKIFLAFAVSLAAFGAVAAFSAVRLHELRRELRLLTTGYLPLTRIAAELEVRDWVASRALEARSMDRASRQVYLPVARAHFPALVKEKLEEGKRVLAAAAPFARGDEARFLADVQGRLDVLASRWAEYGGEAGALFDAIQEGEGGDPAGSAAFEARLNRVRQLEKRLGLDVKLLQVALESELNDRIRATERTESTTVVLIVLYSLIALAVGAGAALISQRLLSPIQRLTEGVKAVAAGDLSRKVEVDRADEIGLLAREFNAMAASLDRQRTELRRAERLAAVGRISAQITHEIRNPLNAIGLNTELLSEEIASLPQPPGEAVAMVAAISREVDRLNGVAEHYLRFARPPRPARERQDLNELLGGLLDFLAPELAAAGVAVDRDLSPELPAIRGDEAQLRGAFLNLLRNAREAMPGGGRIAVRTRPIEGGVEARIGDTGGGIPPGDLTRIFEPFYSTKERGTGLGLSFTQQVIEEHGGTIQCQSEVGRGTTFVLRLPAAGGEARPAGDGVAGEEAPRS
ncbi:MAG TPA: ATP-binding protein [Anaeromyxobacter sp.]|nr:ATP-binding protein [Anaeromyxobacter sp.]